MRKLRQWTLNHPLQFVSVFMLVYFTWFSLLEKYAQPVLMIHSKLDDKIPFCEYFIVPYLLWFVWIAGTFVYFYIKSRDDFYHACRYMFTGMIVCLIIYTLIQNGLNLRPEITNNNIFSRLVDMIWSVDTATNVCPSIHVFNSIAINTVIQHSNAFKHKKLVHVDKKAVKKYQMDMLEYFDNVYPEIGKEIDESKVLSDELGEKILQVADEFKDRAAAK